ncbi:MAG: hypothetical protein HC844_07560 [Tabrizicola sp.]|nr:hypothetical protein [Tabrizicola sp.]
MPLVPFFNPDDGRRRLLEQPHDVVPRDPARRGRRLAEATASYQSLFDEYRTDLMRAWGIADPWWSATVSARETSGVSREEALKAAWWNRIAGPASHPIVIWIVRTYWMECDGLNAESPGDEAIYPEEFMLSWLIEAEEPDLAGLIACMPYWPVGLDRNGNWC